MTKTQTAAALRAWAEGSYDVEAAAELLIRAFDGALLDGPWIVQDGGRAWFDTHQVSDSGQLSGGQRRVLAIAASLADADQRVALSEVLPGSTDTRPPSCSPRSRTPPAPTSTPTSRSPAAR